jgi:predicted nucleic acid-binding protein
MGAYRQATGAEGMSARRLIVAESPAAYLQRPKLVVDASVMCAMVYGEADADDAEAWLRGRSLCAPHLIDMEVANTGLSKLRRRGVDAQKLGIAMDWYAAMDLDRYAVNVPAVLRLALEYGLTAYDASYLWLAESLGAPLATFDAQLGEAAKKHLGGTPPAA